MKKFLKNNQSALTLIELLVVIAILAVLATLYVPRILTGTNKAKRAVEIANARTLASEITMYNSTATTKIKGTGVKSTYDWLLDTDHNVILSTQFNSLPGGLSDGRAFPDTDIVYLVTDKEGNCYIVTGEKSATPGSPITEQYAEATPVP